jgi:L-serine/L-threonine ammonia-lyase
MQSPSAVEPLHVITPLQLSTNMTQSLSTLTSDSNVQCWVKLDCVQPGGSFKIRGIGHLAQKAFGSGITKLCSSSGGNAGMATAYAASVMSGMTATVVVPTTTPAFARKKIEALGAEVLVRGDVWDEADQHVRQMVQELGEDKACYVPPFEHPTIWEGHASMIDEIKVQMKGQLPSCIVVSVGGGGLLCGVLLGLQRNGWESVPVVAVETQGAESFHRGMAAGKPVRLEGGITSIAKSLGATIVSPNAIKMSQLHPGTVTSIVVSDAAAVNACCQFADDQRCMVEPACGAALAGAAYDAEGVALGVAKLLEASVASDDADKKQEGEQKQVTKNVIVIACGGNIVSRDMMDSWAKKTK